MRETKVSTAERVIGWYGWLVRLYPRRFRVVFGEELQAVFAQAVREATRCDQQATWNCFLQELLDLPLNLMREYVSGARISLLVERLLTSTKHSRWQRSGALAFALGFALLELLHGLAQIMRPGYPDFASVWGFFKVTTAGSSQGGNGWNVNLGPVDFACMALSGLVVGLAFSLAEQGISRAGRLRFALAGAAGLVAPYLMIDLFLRWPTAGRIGLGTFGTLLLLLVLFILVGGLPAAVLGWAAGARHGRHLLGLTGRGLGGLILGLIGGALVSVGLYLLLLAPFLLLPHGLNAISPWMMNRVAPLCLSVLFGVVQGWVYGGVVCSRIGELSRTGR